VTVSPIPLAQLPSHPTCTLCPLHTVATHVGISTHYLPGSLPPSPSTPCVLFLGQNPGFNEDRVGTPFIGKSGQLLQHAYIDGIHLRTLASIFLANTARCYHLHGEGPTNSHYRACRPYLLPDLHHLSSISSSLYVVCLGGPASTHLHALLGKKSATLTSCFQQQGTPYPLPPLESPSETPKPNGKRKVRVLPTPDSTEPRPLPDLQTASPTPQGQVGPLHLHKTLTTWATFHPAAVLRTGNLIHAVEGHLTLLLHRLTGRSPVPSTPHLVLPSPPPRA